MPEKIFPISNDFVLNGLVSLKGMVLKPLCLFFHDM